MTKEWSRRAAMAGLAGVVATSARAASGAAPTPAQAAYPPSGVRSHDPAFDALVAPDAPITEIMSGFKATEGPCWVGGADGYLLVCDAPGNVIRRWSPHDGQSDFLSPSGYAGAPSVTIRDPGASGIIVARGGIVLADNGNRILSRLDLRTRRMTVLARDFQGRRFNSPNDMVLHPNGAIYFTDPPYGLLGTLASPARELDYMGVFRLDPDGTVSLIDRSINIPNGIALSPDARTLYTTEQTKGWPAIELDAAGWPVGKRMFVDTATTGFTGGDGLKVDADGNMWTSSREGISCFDPSGRRIGSISVGVRAANCEIGADGYLYICATTKMMRVPVGARKLVF